MKKTCISEKYTEVFFTVYYREICLAFYVFGTHIHTQNRNPVIVFMPLEDVEIVSAYVYILTLCKSQRHSDKCPQLL